MTPEQIKEGLLTLEREHPFYRALLGAIDEDIKDETEGATVRGLNDGDRQFMSGRLAHARDIRNVITGMIEDAGRERTEAVAKAERRRQAEKAAKRE